MDRQDTSDSGVDGFGEEGNSLKVCTDVFFEIEASDAGETQRLKLGSTSNGQNQSNIVFATELLTSMTQTYARNLFHNDIVSTDGDSYGLVSRYSM